LAPGTKDHGLYYERNGRLRRLHADGEDEDLIDDLRNPDYGFLKQEAMTVFDLCESFIRDGPGHTAEFNKRQLSSLRTIEERALAIAAYAAALIQTNGSIRR
jgi:hypothetical protein